MAKKLLAGFALFLLTSFGSVLAQTADQAQSSSTSAYLGSQGSMSDNEFVSQAAQGGMAEVELGQLAQQKAQSPDVKEYAQRMVTDHTQANQKLQQIASGQKITIPSTMDSAHRSMRDRLSGLSGQDFDREYMKGQINDHAQTISLFRREADNGQGALKSWASSTLPTLEEHARMARDVASKLGISQTSSNDMNDNTGQALARTESGSSVNSDTASTQTGGQSNPDSASQTATVPRSGSSTTEDSAHSMVNNRTSDHTADRDQATSPTDQSRLADNSTTASSTVPDRSGQSTSSSTSANTTSSSDMNASNYSGQNNTGTTGSTSTSTDTSSSTDQSRTDTTTTQGTDNGNLPRTASPLPLMGLLGLLSLGGAAVLRLRRQHS